MFLKNVLCTIYELQFKIINEFLNIIEVPEELDKKILREKLSELYDECS